MILKKNFAQKQTVGMSSSGISSLEVAGAVFRGRLVRFAARCGAVGAFGFSSSNARFSAIRRRRFAVPSAGAGAVATGGVTSSVIQGNRKSVGQPLVDYRYSNYNNENAMWLLKVCAECWTVLLFLFFSDQSQLANSCTFFCSCFSTEHAKFKFHASAMSSNSTPPEHEQVNREIPEHEQVNPETQ